MDNYNDYNNRIAKKSISSIEFDMNIVFYKFFNNLLYKITELIRSINFEWEDDTFNLRASIGAGIYDKNGVLVNWSGKINPINTLSKSKKYKGNRVYYDGNDLLQVALNNSQPTGSTYSLRVFVSNPYGYFVDSNPYKGNGWIDILEREVDNLMISEWNKFKYGKTKWRKS